MAKPIRKQQIARLLQQTLGEIFLQESPRLFGKVMITVTDVQMISNLGLAKIYISALLDGHKKELLNTVAQHKNEIRGLLGRKLGSKLRRIPDIQFYIDNSLDHAIHMERLINNLDPAVDTEEQTH